MEQFEQQSLQAPEEIVVIESPYPRKIPVELSADFAMPEWRIQYGKLLIFFIAVWMLGLLLPVTRAYMLNDIIMITGGFGMAFEMTAITIPSPALVVSNCITPETDHPLARDLIKLGRTEFSFFVASEGRISTATTVLPYFAEGLWNQLNHRQRLALILCQKEGEKFGWGALILTCTIVALPYGSWRDQLGNGMSAVFAGMVTTALIFMVIGHGREHMRRRRAAQFGLKEEYLEARQVMREIRRKLPLSVRLIPDLLHARELVRENEKKGY